MNEIPTKKCMVTLVHGTWARKAPWTRKKSRLYDTLNAQGYKVERVEWDSWNRFATREAAAEKLRKHLDDNDGYDHFVIAHSHGGNVAIRALDGDDNVLRGLVCLNTPFFNILGRDSQMFSSILMYFTLAASMIPVGLYLTQGWSWWLPLFYILIAFVAGLVHVVAEKVYAYIQNKGKRFHFKRLKTTPIYCLNVADDEAFGFLAFLSSLQNMLFLFISRAVVRHAAFGVGIALLLVFGIIPFLHLPWDLISGNTHYGKDLLSLDEYSLHKGGLSWVAVLCKLFFLLIMQLFYYGGFYLGLVLAILIALSTAVTLSQGFLAPLSGLFNRFIVTLKPLGSNHSEFREFPGDSTELRHSSMYNSKQVVENIERWIRSRT